jgi:hypothetical protein
MGCWSTTGYAAVRENPEDNFVTILLLGGENQVGLGVFCQTFIVHDVYNMLALGTPKTRLEQIDLRV